MLQDKSFAFAVRIVNAVKFLHAQHKEYVLSKQLLRSGTAIGALIAEGEFAQSKANFVSKLSIALKEANETRYWLALLHSTHYLNKSASDSLIKGVTQLIAMLVSSIKTAKKVKSEK
ncbi:four helix bundle protein [Thiomicrospira microaerophila]|uniref:four helix bundle protein n=1 Tax=Thiomicrospira microaerophila TaxID=406020 RepID=UPI0006960F6E|nr:four helix bundle protein [Thiomicrospira microaerophila]